MVNRDVRELGEQLIQGEIQTSSGYLPKVGLEPTRRLPPNSF